MNTTSKQNILILTGNSSHGWPELTEAIESILIATDLFNIEISRSPPQDAAATDWDLWQPDFRRFAAVVNIYEGRLPNATMCRDFEAYVEAGGGLLVLHSAVVAFENWAAYNDMIGIGWRNAWAGFHLIVEDSGAISRLPPFHGVGPGHGKQHAFQVRNCASEHPIMKDLPPLWMHGKDELYHGMRGPAKHIEVLASAYSAKEQWGSGDNEPMLWTTSFGEGRIATTVLGHRWYDDRIEGHPVESENREEAVHCIGYQTLIARSVEWVVTGQVSLNVPETWPSEDAASIVAPRNVRWSIDNQS